MKRIMFVALLLSSTAAHAEPIVLRAKANEYALVGVGTVVTKDCTVTAEGSLTARISKNAKGQRWLIFRDGEGRREADCEIRYTIGMARTPGNDLLAVK